MERGAICGICGGVALPAYTCKLCGTIVCSGCYSAPTGLCIRCASKMK